MTEVSYCSFDVGGMGDKGRPREMYALKEREVEDLWGNQVETGTNFSKYDSIHVKVLGENKPLPIANFQTSGLATVLLRQVVGKLQLSSFRSATALSLQGHPLAQAPQAVIITPARELAIQISDEARKFATGTDVKTAILYGSTQTMHQVVINCSSMFSSQGFMYHLILGFSIEERLQYPGGDTWKTP